MQYRFDRNRHLDPSRVKIDGYPYDPYRPPSRL